MAQTKFQITLHTSKFNRALVYAYISTLCFAVGKRIGAINAYSKIFRIGKFFGTNHFIVLFWVKFKWA